MVVLGKKTLEDIWSSLPPNNRNLSTASLKDHDPIYTMPLLY